METLTQSVCTFLGASAFFLLLLPECSEGRWQINVVLVFPDESSEVFSIHLLARRREQNCLKYCYLFWKVLWGGLLWPCQAAVLTFLLVKEKTVSCMENTWLKLMLDCRLLESL